MDANVYRKIDGSAFRFGIVRARFNEEITKGLLDACRRVLASAGVKAENVDIVEVPGSVELSYALNELVARGEYDALIALSAIIKGATPHFDYISKSVMDGIREIALAQRVPVIAGVITALNREQAVERSGDGPLNRGVEAAEVALEMAQLRKERGWV